MEVQIKKTDEKLRLVYGEAYIPNVLDSDSEFISTETLRKMAHKFMLSGNLGNIDTEHNGNKVGAHVVESFIAREGDLDFIVNSWVVVIFVSDEAVFADILSGVYNGFSIAGPAEFIDSELEIKVPGSVSGETQEEDGHTHSFIVNFSPTGVFLGGRTDITENHFHEIINGTLTEDANGHAHKFSHVEQLI